MIVFVLVRTLILSLRLTGYGIHHCFARSVLEGSVSHLHYYALAAIAVASCMVLFPVVAGFGRRGGLLTFMIITALASLLQLGLLNRTYSTVQYISERLWTLTNRCLLSPNAVIGKYSIWHDAGKTKILCITYFIVVTEENKQW